MRKLVRANKGSPTLVFWRRLQEEDPNLLLGRTPLGLAQHWKRMTRLDEEQRKREKKQQEQAKPVRNMIDLVEHAKGTSQKKLKVKTVLPIPFSPDPAPLFSLSPPDPAKEGPNSRRFEPSANDKRSPADLSRLCREVGEMEIELREFPDREKEYQERRKARDELVGTVRGMESRLKAEREERQKIRRDLKTLFSVLDGCLKKEQSSVERIRKIVQVFRKVPATRQQLDRKKREQDQYQREFVKKEGEFQVIRRRRAKLVQKKREIESIEDQMDLAQLLMLE